MTDNCNEDAAILAEQYDRLRVENAKLRGSADRGDIMWWVCLAVISFSSAVLGVVVWCGSGENPAALAPCHEEVMTLSWDFDDETCSHPSHKMAIDRQLSFVDGDRRQYKFLVRCTCQPPPPSTSSPSPPILESKL